MAEGLEEGKESKKEFREEKSNERCDKREAIDCGLLCCKDIGDGNAGEGIEGVSGWKGIVKEGRGRQD